MRKCAIIRGLWGFLENNISRFRMRFVLEGCVFSEKMIFYKMSRAIFFEEFEGVFFVRDRSGHFLESYAVFLGTFYRASPEAGLKTGVVC
jgi:hypothetical protein